MPLVAIARVCITLVCAIESVFFVETHLLDRVAQEPSVAFIFSVHYFEILCHYGKEMM